MREVMKRRRMVVGSVRGGRDAEGRGEEGMRVESVPCVGGEGMVM